MIMTPCRVDHYEEDLGHGIGPLHRLRVPQGDPDLYYPTTSKRREYVCRKSYFLSSEHSIQKQHLNFSISFLWTSDKMFTKGEATYTVVFLIK